MAKERCNKKAVDFVIARLKKIRHKRGIIQTDVYIDTDINIGRIECGNGNISISTLADLCEYYQISLKEFFDAPGTPELSKPVKSPLDPQ